eukprot:Nk52_evm53s554 gene=Nk52_evmTU53s554
MLGTQHHRNKRSSISARAQRMRVQSAFVSIPKQMRVVLGIAGLICIYLIYNIFVGIPLDGNREPLPSPMGYEKIHIALSGDKDYIDGMVATINSTSSSCSAPRRLNFHIITTDEATKTEISETIGRLFANKVNKIKYEIFVFDESLLTSKPRVWEKIRGDNEKAPIMYARFFLSSIFERKNIEKIIYLGNDVIVKKDIIPLWKTNLKRPIGAVKMCNTPSLFKNQFNYEMGEIQKFEMNECSFSAGVLLYNLRKWREGKYEDELMRWMALNGQKKLWGLGTQPAFNLVFYQNFDVLDEAWNLNIGNEKDSNNHPLTRTKTDVEEAAILHWTGQYKPWMGPGPSQEYWLEFMPKNSKGQSFPVEISEDRLVTRVPDPEEKFTVVIVSHKRSDTLGPVIQNIRKSPHLKEVVVVWNNITHPCPSFGEHNHQVRCVPQKENKVHNRFRIFPEIHTEAVFHHDDDTIVPIKDMEMGFRTFQLFRNRMVGFEPRRIYCTKGQDPECQYRFLLEEGVYHIIIGKIFFVNRKFMELYETWGEGKLLEYSNSYPCEDVAMNFLVGHESKLSPIWVKGNPKEIKSKQYSGLSTEKNTNIWKRERHSCIGDLKKIFGSQPIVPGKTKVLEYRKLEESLYFQKVIKGESWCSDENGGRKCRQK